MSETQIEQKLTATMKKVGTPLVLEELLKRAELPKEQHQRAKQVVRNLVLQGQFHLTKDWHLKFNSTDAQVD